MTDEALLTPREVARRLHVSRRTVYHWISSGRLSAVRLSERGTRVPASAVSRLLGRADLSSLLWDVDPADIDEERHARFLIERILDEGSDDQVAWMFGRYPSALIRDVLATSRRLSKKSASAWSTLIGEAA